MASKSSSLKTLRLASLGVAAVCVSHDPGALAQTEPSYFMRSAPYPVAPAEQPQPYNLKFGKLTAKFSAAIHSEFSDNVNLSETDPSADIWVGPHVGMGFLLPLTQENMLKFDIGVGWRFYLRNTHLNSTGWYFSPDTRLNQQLRMKIGQAVLSVYDNFYIQVDPISNANVSTASPEKIVNFRRLNNDLGAQVAWQPMRDLNALIGYDYIIDYSLNDDFTQLDRDDHVISGALNRPINQKLTVGITGSHKWTHYVEKIQNDGTTWSVGPMAIYTFSDFLSMDAGVAYTRAVFEQTGTIGDLSGYDGLTFFGGVKHTLNSRMSHNVRVQRSLSPGFGSNFTDSFSLQYGISASIAKGLSLSSTFIYEDSVSSGTSGDPFNRYLFYIGAAMKLSKNWDLGLGYSFAWKDSETAGQGYKQNRVVLDLRRTF